jgi:hypothetical protein
MDIFELLVKDLKKVNPEDLMKRLEAVRRRPFDPATEKMDELPTLLARAVLANDC